LGNESVVYNPPVSSAFRYSW